MVSVSLAVFALVISRISVVTQARLLNVLQQMKEIPFTEKVVIPLLHRIGYTNIEEHGGPDEKGKDLICWGIDRWGHIEVTAIQVKCMRFTRKTADSKSFAGLVTQLGQAAATPIPHSSGKKYIPNEVLFITPYEVDARTLESHFETYQTLRDRGVRVIPGQQIADLLIGRLPDLVGEVLGPSFLLAERLTPELDNHTLLEALQMYSSPRRASSIFVDLDLAIGGGFGRVLAAPETEPNEQTIAVGRRGLQAYRRLQEVCQEVLGVPLLRETLEEIEQAHDEEVAQFRRCEKDRGELLAKQTALAQEMKALEKRIDEGRRKLKLEQIELQSAYRRRGAARGRLTRAESEISALRRQADQEAQASEVDGSTLSSGYVKVSELEERRRRARGQIDEALAVIARLEKPLQPLMGQLHRLSERATQLSEEHVEREEGRPLDPSYRLTVDGVGLARAFKKKRRWLVDQVKVLNGQTRTPRQLEAFFSKAHELFQESESILREPLVRAAVGFGTQQGLFEGPMRLSIEIGEVIDTGQDLLLLGEAGAGKTTSLQAYFERLLNRDGERVAVLVPLARLFTVQADNPRPTGAHADLFEDLVASYLEARGAKSSLDALRMKRDQGKLVLLLDGLDEVIKSNPWMPECIRQFKVRYPDCQVVVSSRLSSHGARSLPFLGLRLLPFTDAQREAFARSWLGEAKGDTAQRILDHLSQNPDLSEIVRNPLLATILCVLAEHEIPLPTSESHLYSERLRLLLGAYDIGKQISRLESRRDILEKVARHVAFRLHAAHKRYGSSSTLEAYASEALRGERTVPSRRRKSVAKVALAELVDPCDVLMPMTHDGHPGFGHLRFQEHLAAQELRYNRNLPLDGLLDSEWWRGVLLFFAEDASSVKWLVEDILAQGSIGAESCLMLQEMIARGPQDEQTILGEMLEANMGLNDFDLMLFQQRRWMRS